jgi:hypothetical protein
MDVVENQSYITQWVEDNIINKVKDTILEQNITEGEVEGIIEMAVKENSFSFVRMKVDCENVIENGVRHTEKSLQIDGSCVIEDTVQNGVKETNSTLRRTLLGVDDIIQNGIKSVIPNRRSVESLVDDTIENGVKEIYEYKGFRGDVKDVIQDGVRKTLWISTEREGLVDTAINQGVKDTLDLKDDYPLEVDDVIQDGVKLTQFNDNENKSWVEGVIKNGVKETKERKDNDFYNPFTFRSTKELREKMISDIIDNGVKETNPVDVMGFFNNKMEDTLQNGVRHTLNTEYVPMSMVEDIIQSGVKETKTPGNGDLVSTVEWLKENNSTSYPKMIDDVIDNGVKKTMLRQHITDGNVETIIETGIKEVQPLPDQSGELIGYGNYYKLKEDRTKAFIDYLEETIKFGVKN